MREVVCADDRFPEQINILRVRVDTRGKAIDDNRSVESKWRMRALQFLTGDRRDDVELARGRNQRIADSDVLSEFELAVAVHLQ